jgi:hypothetical protein
MDPNISAKKEDFIPDAWRNNPAECCPLSSICAVIEFSPKYVDAAAPYAIKEFKEIISIF